MKVVVFVPTAAGRPFVSVVHTLFVSRESRNWTVNCCPGELGQLKTTSVPCRVMVVMTALADTHEMASNAANAHRRLILCAFI